jgi:hypothetical protein
MEHNDRGVLASHRHPITPSLAVIEKAWLILELVLRDSRPKSDDGGSLFVPLPYDFA